jgi:hypothetical protein
MPGFERQEGLIKTSADGSQQQQTVTKRAPLMSQESPSTIRYLVQNEEYLKSLARQLAGWAQIPDKEGRMEWQPIGKPLINERGRGWLLSQLSSVQNKSIFLSNFPEWRMRSILETEFESIALHLSTHLKEYELAVEDTENLMLYIRRAVEASYRRSVNDRGAKHVFGSFDESVNMTQQREPRKLFGLVPY